MNDVSTSAELTRSGTGKSRRALVGGAMGTLGVLALAACGGQGAGSGQPATQQSSASGTVRYMAWGNAFSDGIENKVIDAYHKAQSKVKLEFTNFGDGDAFVKLQATLAGGDPPDTALVDGYNVRALVKSGGAQDVTARMTKDGVKKDDYIAEWFDEFLYKGKYYYHPNMRGSTASFYYNKTLLEKYGAKVPTEGWTLNDWLDIAQKTTRDGAGRSPTQGGFDHTTASIGTVRPGLWWPFLWVNGGDLIDMEKNTCVLDSPAAIESFQFLQDLVHKHKVTRDAFQGLPGEADLFSQGRLAIVHGWFTNIPQYRQQITNFEWDTVVMPQGKLRKQVGLYKGNGEVLPTGAKNPDGGWDFMKFLGGYEAMLIYGVEGRFVPALKKAANDPAYLKSGKPPKSLNTFTDNRVRTLPLMPEWNAFNRDIWNPALANIWNNTAPIKDIATDIARQTTEFIKNREKY